MKKTLLLTLVLSASLQAAAPVRNLVVAYAPRDTLDFKLVAAYERSFGWRNATEVEGKVGTKIYNIYALGANLGQVEGSQPRPRGEDGVVGRLPRKLYRDSILIAGDFPDICKMTAAPSGDDSAQKAVAAFLQSHGVEVAQVKLHQNLVVDLNGDGTPERLVVAGQREPYSDLRKPGEYSLAAVIQDGQLTPLEFQSAREQADTPWEDYVIMLAGHLDGKGPAEVILRYEYYEGGGVLILGQEAGAWKVMTRSDWGV